MVQDYKELRTARAWHQRLEEMGVEAALTSDWQLDRWGRGDIALRVPPGLWSEADDLLNGEPDDDPDDFDDDDL